MWVFPDFFIRIFLTFLKVNNCSLKDIRLEHQSLWQGLNSFTLHISPWRKVHFIESAGRCNVNYPLMIINAS